ncbi:MAG: hypothetical protein M9894_34660 [Planctomycetes bacterium]|nr:hypothetical protein [Planctomycetota bacterium]
MSAKTRAALVGLLLLAAVAPRVEPALRGYHPSNDAAEHLLIARSLARGEGFTLPIRVRDVDGGPAVHDAYPERAPLYPWLLSAPVRLGIGATGWPDPRLQLLGVGLAALCAPLVASVAAALARARGFGAGGLVVAAAGAGLVVAWAPSLVRASVHLWAEPLGLLLVLGAARLDLALDRGGPGRAALAGLVGGLARFARPEAWVVAPLLLARAVARARREPGRWSEALALGGALLAVNAAGIAATGVVAPQLFLLEVARFEDAMGAGAAPAAPTLGSVLAAVGGNLAGQLEHLLLPKNAWFVLPLALLALVRRGRGADERWLLAWAAAFVLATAGVWSTRDPHRFTIAPLALLAPVALVEAEAWRRRLWPGRRGPLAAAAASLVLVLGHAAGREARGRGPGPAPEVVAREGAPALDDPWSYALVTGRPAVLARPPAR